MFTFTIFPKDDPEQTLRIKRFFIAFASYVVFGALADFSFALGLTLVPLHVLAVSQSAIILCNVLIYATFRTGFNKRFKDPSLTFPQILMATFWAMEVLYYADTTRGVALLVYLAIFIFGLFKLNVRQFLFLSFFTIAGYSMVILLLYRNHPGSINVKSEILNIVVLAIVLPWFSLIGGYITRLKAKVSDTLRKIQETELKFGIIFNNASDGIIVVNTRDKKFSDGNEKMCNMLGYAKEELLKLGIYDIHPPEAIPLITDQFNKLLRKEISIIRNIPVLKKDKTEFYADISVSTVVLGKNEYAVGMFRDITERKRAEEELRKSEQRYMELSIIDDLTRLYNSRYFYAQLKKEMERSKRYEQPLTLIMLDLDKFKIFNDQYGHVEGDRVLSRLGQVIKRCLRDSDSAYRYGGEEFTIILPMTQNRDGFVTAERIQTEFRKEVFTPVPGEEITVTMSIGFSQYKPEEDMKAFVHRVDQLMYQAKKNGKDRIVSESQP